MSGLNLSLDGITKRFGATLALDNASITVRAGSLHALLGENGAGKTTLMRLAFGMTQPDAGTLSVNGAARRWRSSADAISAGIGMVHQHFLLVPAMTVAENVALGDRGLLTGFSPRDAAERVKQIGVETGLVLDPYAIVGELTVGAQQRLEIVKAMARQARLLILDEPTAVLSPRESQELYGWLRSFTKSGNSVVLITHKVREALAIADDVTVLRRGRLVFSERAAVLRENAVVDAMIGEHLDTPPAAEKGGVIGNAVLRAINVSVKDDRGIQRLNGATIEVAAGEIVGVAGVDGAGQRELLRVLAGRMLPAAGHATIPSTIGFVPEDRQHDALIPTMTLTENVVLKGAGKRTGVIPWAEMESRTETLIQTHDVRTPGAAATAATLSGGNQQKLVLARELDGAPAALVAENPTRGLDVRATAQVLMLLREARARGVAIIVYSSDIDELVALADRMVVCYEGRVIPASVDADAVGRAMTGAQ